MTRNVLALGGLSAALLLTACNDSSVSGQTGSVTPPPTTLTTAEGSWEGNINTPSANSRGLQGVIEGDGSFWFVYTKVGSNAVAGVIQGSGTSTPATSTTTATFSATGATLLSLEDNTQTTADITADYVAQSSLSGSISHGTPSTGTVTLPTPATFTALYQVAYNQNLTLTDLAGSYTGNITTKAGTETATVTINNTGAITGSNSAGCTLTGQATAQPHGNVFNVTVKFGSETACTTNANLDVSGVVALDTNQLTALALDATKTNSFIFIGTKP